MDFPTRFTLKKVNSETVITRISSIMEKSGFHVVRSFDFQSTISSRAGLKCQKHTNSDCDCQMVVLLIYGLEGSPSSMLVHSHSGNTEIKLVYPPGYYPKYDLIGKIKQSFQE